MLLLTHLAISLLIALLLRENVASPVQFVIFTLLGTMIPDIDTPTSKLGRYFRPFNYVIKHRGFFHGIFFLALISFLTLTWLGESAAFGLLLGHASHIVMDSFTYQGVMVFHPVSQWKMRGFLKTGGVTEYMILLAVLAADLFLVFI